MTFILSDDIPSPFAILTSLLSIYIDTSCSPLLLCLTSYLITYGPCSSIYLYLFPDFPLKIEPSAV